MIQDAGGQLQPSPPTLDVRMHGPGVRGNEVSLEEAFDLLSPLQHALSSIGQSIAQVATGAGRIPEVIKRATELKISPAVSIGSVVFHLRGPGEDVTGDEIPGSTETDTLADVAMQSLLRVVQLADTSENSLDIASQIRRFGPRSAKHLNDLSKAVVDHEIDLGFQWRNPRGQKSQGLLNRRGALGLQGAISHNRSRTSTVTLEGILATVSVVEPAAIRLDDERLIRLEVSPEVALTLDQYCYKRVVVQAEETIVWNLSKGNESRQYTLLSIHLHE
ncbi:hypothetical protein ACLQ2Y_27705 [Micromonospora echinospora]|uniref:hypothetical protein n=1 Tax=Micromonospora echinospora TaxID=1877 RepID=UPI003CE688B5